MEKTMFSNVHVRTIFTVAITAAITGMLVYVYIGDGSSTSLAASGTWPGSMGVRLQVDREPVDFYQTTTPYENEVLRPIATHAPNDTCIKRFPQAIIVGIQKSGTTALLKFLEDHPEIVACTEPAETKYFSQHFSKPLSWYIDLMPCSYSNQVTMEKSPPYFYRSFCASRIRNVSPRTKIIIIVKDPIVRTVSMYAMMKSELSGRSFEDVVTLNNRTKLNTASRFLDFSNYPKHMKAWRDNFESRQIHIVDGHNMETDPAQELRLVEKFLQVGNYFTSERFAYNETKGKYCLVTEDGEHCLSEKKGRPHPTISTPVRTLLEKHFKPKNEQFFQMIHRRLDWGY